MPCPGRRDSWEKNVAYKCFFFVYLLKNRTIREEAWSAETIRPSNMNDRACENTHPSRAANMAIHGLNSAAASDFLDNEDSQAPLKANVLSGYRVINGT